MTWWKVVGFGLGVRPPIVSTDRSEVERALTKASKQDVSGNTGINTRIYGYKSRTEAREGNIADSLGESGRVA